MKATQPKFFFPAAMLTALGLLALVGLAHGTTITWTNTSGGNWSNTNNWSPHLIPTNTDTTLITMPGTYTVVFDLPSYSGGNPVFYPSIVSNLTVGAGINASGAQTLVITNLSPYSIFEVKNLLLVTNGGVLNVTNGNIEANPLTIDQGGNFNGSSVDVIANVTVANGGLMSSVAGQLTANNGQGFYSDQTLMLTNGGTLNSFDDTIGGTLMVASGGIASVRGVTVDLGFVVQHGGTLNLGAAAGASYGASLIVDSPSTNYGTINMTNGMFVAEYGLSLGGNTYGSFVNGPGGVFNLFGYGGVYSQSSLLNQGAILQASGSNYVIGLPFDTSSGTVSNLSSVLSLGYESNFLAGTYYAAPNTTIQLQGVDLANDNSAAQLVLGTPFVLAGPGQFQLSSGYLYLPNNVPTNLQLQCDSVTLGAGFQGGNITNLLLAAPANGSIRLINPLPLTGTLTMANCTIYTNFTVASGGILNAGNSTFAQLLTVNAGGVAILTGVNMGAALVSHNGTMTVTGSGLSTTGFTNAGTVNLEGPTTYTREILNQAGGVINLLTNATINIPYPSVVFLNQGAIVQNAGAGNTNLIGYQTTISFEISSNFYESINIYAPFAFDTSQGTVTNLSGMLILPGFSNVLSGKFFAAAGATIGLGGGTTNTSLIPGSPLTLGGPGQIEFLSGYLYLATNAIPGLSLVAGQLELGPVFQGGAITNLTLDGIALTNQLSSTLPVTGTFTVLASGSAGSLNAVLNHGWYGYYGNGVYGNYTVANGGVMTVSNATFNGAMTVSSGGALSMSIAILNGAVTVNGGGLLNGAGTIYGPVTVASGGVLNPSSILNLSAPLNNSGTINLTNSQIEMYNDGTTNYTGSLINQAGGLIKFLGNGVIGGSGGYDYVANQGQIIDDSAGSGYTLFNVDNATNLGTITVQKGQLFLAGPWTLLPAGSLNVALNSATNYGNIFFASHSGPVGASAVLAGAFNATLNNGYVPTNGTTFNVLDYGSLTGSFSSLGLPTAVSWQSNYGSTNFTLLVGSPKPQFGTFNLAGTNLIFNGLGGSPGSNYVVLASTNLALPLANWSALATNIFDGSGQFHYTNQVSPAKPRQFFIFKLP